MNHEEFVSSLKEARLELNKFYQILPITILEEPALANGWSVKDLLANLAARDRLVVEQLAADNLAPLSEAELAVSDETIYRERNDWFWEEVEAESQAAFAALLDSLETPLSEAQQTLLAAHTLERYRHYTPILERYAARYRHQRRR